MFERSRMVDEGGAALLHATESSGWLPEDAGRSAVPSQDVVTIDDLPAWDAPAPGGPAWVDWRPPDEQLPEDASAAWQTLAGIADVPPDAMLALVLEQVDLTGIDDQMVVETVAAWRRIAAWAELNQALGAAELSRRASMNPNWSAPAPANRSVAGDELAMRLACSKRAADRLVRDGRALENELLLTAEAVRDGRLDGAQMRAITDRLHDRPGELAWAVQEAVLPIAATRTPAQLAADIDRALLEVDPIDAADRLARAVAARHVCHPKPLPDGMAGIWAVLPAADAARVDTTLEATARAARALGDPRTLDQLRADAFVDIATGQAILAATSPPPAGAAAVDPLSDDPALRSPAPSGDSRAADRGQPHDGPGIAASGGPTRPTPRRGSPGIRIPTIHVNVTVALSTLMGLDEKPGELAGFGPISAEQARALATGGVWRRLVTDPLSGAVLDVGRTRYRPPRPVADHVMARDGVCAAPGCPVPAHRCDLDHTTEYHGRPANGARANGTTSADNLGPLSDRCHRLKTDGGFTLTQPEPGVFQWRTPAGLAYRVTPSDHGRVERITTHPNPGYPDEPPF